MITWVLIVTTVVLILAQSWWWLIATLLLSLYKANNWYFYQSRPWRCVHFPAMRLYAIAAGTESIDAKNKGRVFNIRNALINLLKMLQPELDVLDSEKLVDVTIEKCKNYSDEELIRSTFKKRNSKLTDSELNNLMGRLEESIIRTHNSWYVRIFLAEIIEQQHGTDDRGEYIVACIEGDAT